MGASSTGFKVPHEFRFVQNNRRAMLLEHIDLADRGLEIGPYDQPTVVKSEGNIHYLDVQTREELVAGVADQSLAEKIPEVDFLCQTSDYTTVATGSFDYIIANHVLEHVPNPVKWLQMIHGMLAKDGVLFLSLPDKKHTFDKYRPDTPLSHILFDYYTNVETTSLEHMLETELYYDQEFIGKPMNIEERLDPARLKAALDIKIHPGVHCHVFQAETFGDKFLKPLQQMGLIEFEMEAFRGAQANTGGEFSAVLRKQPATTKLTTEQFFTKDYEQKQHVPSPTPDEPSAQEPIVEIPTPEPAHLTPPRSLLGRLKGWVTK